MATVNLGSIKFKWKGTYSGATAYTIDDVVSYNGSSYICILASTGNLPTNATYFEQMSSAGTNGTNGTDLGTTLTTQGDLVYRDGSGLQRLGAGTAGQVLQTGGAGANPSWGTVSSNVVKLADITGDDTFDSFTMDNYFDDSTYLYHEFHYRGLITASSSANYFLRLLDGSGSELSGTNYFTSSAYDQRSLANATATGVFGGASEAQFDPMIDNYGDFATGGGRVNIGYFRFYNTNDSASTKPYVFWHTTSDNGSGHDVYNIQGSGYYKSATLSRGFKMFNTNSADKFSTYFTGTLYGIKK
jgi:hypothetical protein